ncbi:MAG: hypothetical protein ACOYU3_05435 [Bacillota bacterium]
MKPESSISARKIAAVYIGTVVGAGFASGQEVLQFFNAFGREGILGCAVATALFFFFGYSILLLGRSLNARSHVDIVTFTNGRLIGTFIDLVITVFLFGGFAVMIAGAGAISEEQFHISSLWGTVTMALAAFLTVYTGTKGVLNANSIAVPFLLVSVLFVFLYSLATNPISDNDIHTSAQLTGAAPNWITAAINYASYNLVIAIAVLAPLGAKTGDKSMLLRGALMGSVGLGGGILGIYFCIFTNITSVSGVEIPMIEIVKGIFPVFRLLFAFVLLAAVYTTAVGNLYGFIRRIGVKTDSGLSRALIMAGVTAAALAVGQFGFSKMVKYLYPAIGYGGILMFIGILYARAAKRSYFK